MPGLIFRAFRALCDHYSPANTKLLSACANIQTAKRAASYFDVLCWDETIKIMVHTLKKFLIEVTSHNARCIALCDFSVFDHSFYITVCEIVDQYN